MTISVTFCSLFLGLVATAAVAQKQSTTSGSLKLNGKTTNLGYAQAIKAEDWTFGPNNKPVLATVFRVLLSDMQFDDLDDNFELSVMAKEGKLHGILVTFNKNGKLLSGSLYHEASETGVEDVFVSKIMPQSKVLNDKTVSGKIRTEEPISLSAGKLELSATFSASIQEEPKPTVQGNAASETAIGKVVQEFIQAAETKNVAALKKIVRKEVAEMLEKPEGKEAVMGLLGMSYPDGKQIKIVRVFDFGNRAWVEGDSQRAGDDGKPVKETYRIRAIRVNGEWKVSPL
ncbi:MAG: hypothetical protein HY276_03335 [Ignavibacteriales bacterium]|nr:hypothetical protein [Ignavibacteriales bacterium]